MCGRFTLRSPAARLVQEFDVELQLPLRFNIAPTQDVAVIRAGREVTMMRWGLVPPWSKDGRGMINARAETAAENRVFRAAFERRRCLIPADGFYEWAKRRSKKQPYYFSRTDDRPFAFAGLWQRWHDIDTCTILTTAANELVAPIHDRMPVILPPSQYDAWLDGPIQPWTPYPAAELKALPVSTYVNHPRNEGPQCIEPAGTDDPADGDFPRWSTPPSR